jgi:site-specific DNA-methyltransferase (adenine-specific)/adenine-specific DNA-methyltransferase
LNKEDGGNRYFILVEMESDICRNVTAERLRRVCNGYEKPDGTQIEGLGGGFRYCKLGAACFDEYGRINGEVAFSDLARHVFFTETGEPISKQAKASNPLIGIYKGTAVYLLYNGILKDTRSEGGNVLTQAVLEELPKHEGPKVIYGTACRFSPARLKRENIVFKQIPYEIRVR